MSAGIFRRYCWTMSLMERGSLLEGRRRGESGRKKTGEPICEVTSHKLGLCKVPFTCTSEKRQIAVVHQSLQSFAQHVA